MSSFGHYFGPEFSSTDEDDESISVFDHRTMDPGLMKVTCQLPPEPQIGNIEYKLKLDSVSAVRFEELVSQLKWRLEEGNGKAVYHLGVKDNGSISGLDSVKMEESLTTLRKMSEQLNASLSFVETEIKKGTDCKKRLFTVKAIITTHVEQQWNRGMRDLRIALTGPADAGKSTLISVLSEQILDNGRGSARIRLFLHPHEITAGRTSSIITETIGIDRFDHMISVHDTHKNKQSVRTLTLIDLAGHEKYTRTALYGLTAYNPHVIMLLLSLTSRSCLFNLSFLSSFGKPILLVINKSDLAKTLSTCIEQILKDLENVSQSSSSSSSSAPFKIKFKHVSSLNEAKNYAQHFSNQIADCYLFMRPGWLSNYQKNRKIETRAPLVIPVFTVSCMDGYGIDCLSEFLSNLSTPKIRMSKSERRRCRTQFQILSLIKCKSNEIVVAGLMKRGQLSVDDKPFFLGPFRNQQFKNVFVKSIRSRDVPCSSLTSGQFGTLALHNLNSVQKSIKLKALTIFAKKPTFLSFDFDVLITFHRLPIKQRRPANKHAQNRANNLSKMNNKLELVVHINNVCQSAKIVKMSEKEIRLGYLVEASLRFLHKAEHIRSKSLVVVRYEDVYGVGRVLNVYKCSKENV